MNLLVLDTTKATMDSAPRVDNDQFAPGGNFAQESQKLDAFWKAQLLEKATNLPGTSGSKN